MSHPAFPGRLNLSDPDLGERHRRVFAALVTLHGRTAHPVGSEALAARAGIPLSPASIRNALAELESVGFLDRPHSSAGRVPTPRGFEYYVRTLLTPEVLPAFLVDEVDRTLLRSARDIEELLNQASRLLSSLTCELGLALAASLEEEPLSGLDLAALDQHRVLMVLNLGSTAVRTLVLEIDSPLDRRELDEVAEVLRERLLGASLSEVRERLASDPELARRSVVRLVVRAAVDSWARPVSTPLFSAGAMHMAEHPEFASATRLAGILGVVEAGAPLDRLMVGNLEGQVSVRVGLDEDQALAECSLVSYTLPGAIPGAVGVLGPLRMDYARALAVVEAVGARLTELLA
jgi:heat-inducible transcriptional repressor